VVFCVQAHLRYLSDAIRDTRLAQALAFIEGKERWEVTIVVASDDPDPNAIDLSTRFTARVDQEQVESFLLGSAGVQPGSWVQVHDCPHDEARGACTVERRTVV
jgi:hypothetical protein